MTSKNDRDPVWLADFVILDTKAGAISAMFPDGTEHAAGARGYHSLTAFGHWCIVLFGRQDSHTIVSPQKSVAVYNSRSNCWEAVAWKRILTKEDDDQLPPIRSSHRACATTNGILVYGGAPPGIERLSKRRHSASSNGYKSNGRLSDLWLLGIDSETGIMEWKSVEESRSNGKIALEQPELPEGRAGHIMEVVQDDVLYLMGGYNKKSSYCSDIWCWKQNSDVLNSSKKPHENSSRRLLPSPTVTKRARRNQHGGGAGNGSSIEQLHDTIADLQATLKNYQSRESSLLLNQERAVAEIERLRKELRTTDESWQQTARERDYFKVESSEQSARLSSERSEREAQRKALEQRIESLLLETEELKNSLEMTKVNLTNAQAQVNIVQQAAENDRNLLNDLYNNVRKQNEILLARIDSETSQRQQAEHKVEGIEGILAAERVGWEEERAKMKYELSEARALQVKIKSQAKEAIKEVFCKLDQLHHRLQQVKDTTDRAAAAQRRTEELAALARTDNQRLLENVERDQGECNRDVEALRSTLSRMARNLDGAAGLSGEVL